MRILPLVVIGYTNACDLKTHTDRIEVNYRRHITVDSRYKIDRISHLRYCWARPRTDELIGHRNSKRTLVIFINVAMNEVINIQSTCRGVQDVDRFTCFTEAIRCFQESLKRIPNKETSSYISGSGRCSIETQAVAATSKLPKQPNINALSIFLQCLETKIIRNLTFL